MKRIRASRLGLLLMYAVLTIWAVISLIPLYWVFTTAFQQPNEVQIMPPKFIPTVVSRYLPLRLTGQKEAAQALVDGALESFRLLFQRTDMVRWFMNSALIAVSATAGVLFLDSMAAFSFAKKQFPGREFIFWLMISTMMIPGQVLLVPMFMVVRNLGIVNTPWAILLPQLSMVFGVFLLRQFMSTIPSELIEAARIDGAGEFGIYWRVMLPLAKPGLATLGILTFSASWNSFLWPLIAVQKSEWFTLPVGLKTLQDQNLVNYGLLMSGAAVAAVPMIIVFLSFQKYFIRGLTLGGVKG
ncbi:MAG: carbohydrate ABC transporter permease [Firmicutes bacterium]|jgi:multiple sugar transport system permease protein|nr:carbohydrate ABC transporter permease [Bacillota bacterium]